MLDQDSLQSSDKEIEKLKAELKEQIELADIGELAGTIAHKFNNFLNSLLLKIALVEPQLPEPIAAKFAEIRQQAKSVAEVIKQVHQFRSRPVPAPGTIDFNSLVAEVTQSLRPSTNGNDAALRLEVELSTQPATVAGSAMDYKRMCAFLLRNRLGAPSTGNGTLHVRTEVVAGKVIFSIADSRTNVDPALVTGIFEMDGKASGESNKLELAACKSLVRRFQGRIQAQPRAEGGLVFSVELPLAAP